MPKTSGRDRLRELLDAVLDDEHHSLTDMAGGAYSSPYHFTRQLSREAGEPPVAMRRRVMLERAAWQLRHGCLRRVQIEVHFTEWYGADPIVFIGNRYRGWETPCRRRSRRV